MQACPTCGARTNVHGDCLVCDAPFGAPKARTVYVHGTGETAAVGEPPRATTAAIDHVIDALAERCSARAVEHHLTALPASYVRRHTPDAVARHLALIERAGGGTAVEHVREGGIDRITVVTHDRAGLLERLAGTLAVRSVHIAGAVAFTREDGVVIDVIDVAPQPDTTPDDRYWSAVCDDLARALADDAAPLDDGSAFIGGGPPPAADAPRIPTTLYVHNMPDERFSKVEVNAADRPGLLYALTRALREESLDVQLAEVETIGALAVDTFYVVDANGHRLEDAAAIARLQSRVRDAVAALDGS